MPGLVPEIREQCVVINSVSKSYAMTGWRVGWLVAPADVAAAAVKIQSHSTSNVANVSQAAALAALEGSTDLVRAMRDAYDRRRRMIIDRLAALPGVAVSAPLGAFYVFPSFEAHLGGSIAGHRVDTTVDLAKALLEEALVATVPGEAFGAPGHLRFSYALGERDLEIGMERLRVLFGV
jgi:aspartate/methionine/tyrosine aminotransferase